MFWLSDDRVPTESFASPIRVISAVRSSQPAIGGIRRPLCSIGLGGWVVRGAFKVIGHLDLIVLVLALTVFVEIGRHVSFIRTTFGQGRITAARP